MSTHLLSSSSPTPSSSTSHLPNVTLKLAFDQNWAVADAVQTTDPSSSLQQRFTSPSSLDMVHRLRRISDAVLVGRTTVQQDDCSLTVRRVPLLEKKQPLRVVVDPGQTLRGTQHKLLRDGLPTAVYCNKAAEEETALYSSSTADGDGDNNHPVTFIPLDPFDLSLLLSDLSSRFQCHHLMVEGGPRTARSFLEAGLVDRAVVVKAPIRFPNPIPSGMDGNDFRGAGLVLLGSYESGGDTIECWARQTDQAGWPTVKLEDWP